MLEDKFVLFDFFADDEISTLVDSIVKLFGVADTVHFLQGSLLSLVEACRQFWVAFYFLNDAGLDLQVDPVVPLDRDDSLNCDPLFFTELATNFNCAPNALQADGGLCLSLAAKNALQLLHLLHNHVLVRHVKRKNLLRNVLDLGFQHLVFFYESLALGLAFPLAGEPAEIRIEF